jgi:hypothetical protein
MALSSMSERTSTNAGSAGANFVTPAIVPLVDDSSTLASGPVASEFGSLL